jgi:hypothetical protein
MGFSKLAIAAGCLLLFVAAFAAGFVLLKSKAGSTSGLQTAPTGSSDDQRDGNQSDASDKKSSDDSSPNAEIVRDSGKGDRKTGKAARPNNKDKAKKTLTCIEATKQGVDCVGERVTWVGKWKSSQSATVENQKGSQHFFYTQSPQGGFTFDYPFIAEEPKPLELAKRPQDILPLRDKKWGPSLIVTVTGTISQVKTLIYIGEGTRYNVPVLTDIKITINP